MAMGCTGVHGVARAACSLLLPELGGSCSKWSARQRHIATREPSLSRCCSQLAACCLSLCTVPHGHGITLHCVPWPWHHFALCPMAMASLCTVPHGHGIATCADSHIRAPVAVIHSARRVVMPDGASVAASADTSMLLMPSFCLPFCRPWEA
jgi:hypothetical protein